MTHVCWGRTHRRMPHVPSHGRELIRKTNAMSQCFPLAQRLPNLKVIPDHFCFYLVNATLFQEAKIMINYFGWDII